MRVDIHSLTVRIEDRDILGDVSLTAAPGTVTGLIGPNGSGKSTLLRCVYRALRPTRGRVLIDEDEVWRLSSRAAGRRTAVVTQDHDLDNSFSVEEIVAMGRLPHKRFLERDSDSDHDTVHAALARVGMEWAAGRVFAGLSGGERQRVLLARALTQHTPVLLLDEPTNHLDIGSQLELLDLVRALDLTVVLAIHDLGHAVALCDQVVLLHEGRLRAAGPPQEVLTPQTVAEVFGVRSAIVPHPLTGRPHLVTASAASADRAAPDARPRPDR